MSAESALNGAVTLKRQVVHRVQRRLVNPVGRQMPGTILETTGRKSGKARGTAVGGRVVNNQFWMVSEHGVCPQHQGQSGGSARIGGRWPNGTAHLLPDDDPLQRLGNLPALNSAVVRLMGSDLLTIRVDLD